MLDVIRHVSRDSIVAKSTPDEQFFGLGGSAPMTEVEMLPLSGSFEGPGPDPKLEVLYEQFEELCLIEGPGAADEGDLCRIRQEMTDAIVARNTFQFLRKLAEGMKLRDGGDVGSSIDDSH
jgi:hypothetical protein